MRVSLDGEEGKVTGKVRGETQNNTNAEAHNSETNQRSAPLPRRRLHIFIVYAPSLFDIGSAAPYEIALNAYTLL